MPPACSMSLNKNCGVRFDFKSLSFLACTEIQHDKSYLRSGRYHCPYRTNTGPADKPSDPRSRPLMLQLEWRCKISPGFSAGDSVRSSYDVISFEIGKRVSWSVLSEIYLGWMIPPNPSDCDQDNEHNRCYQSTQPVHFAHPSFK